MADTAFPALTSAELAFRDLIWKPAIKAGEKYLETQVPFFQLPIIEQLEEAAVEEILDWAFDQIRMVIDVGAIRIVNAAHEAAFQHESVALKIIAQEKGPNSPEYQEERKRAEAALDKFLSYGAAKS